MTHPDHAERAALLAERTGLPGAGVVTDPEPDGPPTALRAARAAFGAERCRVPGEEL